MRSSKQGPCNYFFPFMSLQYKAWSKMDTYQNRKSVSKKRKKQKKQFYSVLCICFSHDDLSKCKKWCWLAKYQTKTLILDQNENQYSLIQSNYVQYLCLRLRSFRNTTWAALDVELHSIIIGTKSLRHCLNKIQSHVFNDTVCNHMT